MASVLEMRKVTISFVMSVRPSASNSSAPGSSEISYLSIFLKSVDKIQVSLISDKNNGTLHENQYTVDGTIKYAGTNNLNQRTSTSRPKETNSKTEKQKTTEHTTVQRTERIGYAAA
jgi:hypothetical protein